MLILNLITMAIQLTDDVQKLFASKGITDQPSLNNLKSYLNGDQLTFIKDNEVHVNGELRELAKCNSVAGMSSAFTTFSKTIELKKVGVSQSLSSTDHAVPEPAVQKLKTERNPYLLRNILSVLYLKIFGIRKPDGTKFSKLREQLKEWFDVRRAKIDIPFFAVLNLSDTDQKDVQRIAMMRLFTGPYKPVTASSDPEKIYLDNYATTLAIQYQKILFDVSEKLSSAELIEKLQGIKEGTIKETVDTIAYEDGFEEAEINEDVRSNYDYGFEELCKDVLSTI